MEENTDLINEILLYIKNGNHDLVYGRLPEQFERFSRGELSNHVQILIERGFVTAHIASNGILYMEMIKVD